MDAELTKTLIYILLAVIFIFGGTKKILRAKKMGDDEDTDLIRNTRMRGMIQIFVALALIIMMVWQYMNSH